MIAAAADTDFSPSLPRSSAGLVNFSYYLLLARKGKKSRRRRRPLLLLLCPPLPHERTLAKVETKISSRLGHNFPRQQQPGRKSLVSLVYKMGLDKKEWSAATLGSLRDSSGEEIYSL